MSLRVIRLLVRYALLLSFMAACSSLPGGPGPATLAGTKTPILEDILVESLEVRMLESFPVQVVVVAKGQLPDACSFIEDVVQEREENTFLVTLTFARQPNMRCAPQPTPFEKEITLDVLGLEAGEYTVNVHGVTETFELAVDNFPESELYSHKVV